MFINQCVATNHVKTCKPVKNLWKWNLSKVELFFKKKYFLTGGYVLRMDTYSTIKIPTDFWPTLAIRPIRKRNCRKMGKKISKRHSSWNIDCKIIPLPPPPPSLFLKLDLTVGFGTPDSVAKPLFFGGKKFNHLRYIRLKRYTLVTIKDICDFSPTPG